MTELEEKVERMEKILTKSFHLARLIRRKANRTTKINNENFEILQNIADNNVKNIDKVVKILQGLVGEAAEWDKKHPEGKTNSDFKMMYL